MIKKLLVGTLALMMVAGSAAWADEIMVGMVLGSEPGEPDFEQKRPTLGFAYEAQKSWRIFYATGEFEHVNNSTLLLNTRIIGVEKLFIYDMGKAIKLIGAFGPGLFTAELDNNGAMESGTAVGIMATGSFRFYLGSGFIDLGYHYRNAAVTILNGTVNGGYQGMVIGGGLAF